MNLKALIIPAVSSNAQAADDKVSLQMQEESALAWCERNNATVVEVLRIPGHSRRYIEFHKAAEAMRRVGIDAYVKLDSYISRNRSEKLFDVLVCWEWGRLARTQGMCAVILERVVLEAGARIFCLDGSGWIDKENFRMSIAIGGFTAASEIDKLVHRHMAANRGKVESGKPISSRLPFSHRIKRDFRGRDIGVEVVPEFQYPIRRMCELLIEGVPFNSLEPKTYKETGLLNPATGKRFSMNAPYFLFWNPAFWGTACTIRDYAGTKRLFGEWVFNPDSPAPKTLDAIRYGAWEPGVPPDLIAKVQAELTRRRSLAGGRPYMQNTREFTGLVVCGACGKNMVYSHLGPVKTPYYFCRGKCPNRKYIREEKVRDFLRNAIDTYIETGGWPMQVEGEAPNPDLGDRIQSLQKISAEISQLQARADKGMWDLYQSQLNAIEDQITQVRQEQKRRKDIQQSRLAANDDLRPLLRGKMDAFWEQPSRKINQMLFTLLQDNRLVSENGEIVRFALARQKKREHRK